MDHLIDHLLAKSSPVATPRPPRTAEEHDPPTTGAPRFSADLDGLVSKISLRETARAEAAREAARAPYGLD